MEVKPPQQKPNSTVLHESATVRANELGTDRGRADRQRTLRNTKTAAPVCTCGVANPLNRFGGLTGQEVAPLSLVGSGAISFF